MDGPETTARDQGGREAPRGKQRARKRRSRGGKKPAARDEAAATPAPELPAGKELSQKKTRSLARALRLAEEDRGASREGAGVGTLSVRERLALLGPVERTHALKITELSVTRPFHALTGRALGVDAGASDGASVRADPRAGLAIFTRAGDELPDPQYPARIAHARVRIPGEAGTRYLVEFELDHAGDGRFVALDALSGVEYRFEGELARVALVHEHPDEASETTIFLYGTHPRWCLRRCLITTLE